MTTMAIEAGETAVRECRLVLVLLGREEGWTRTVDVGGWVVFQDTANDEHHNHHPCSASKERPPATKLVDSNDQEETSSTDLDGAINTSCKQGGIRLRDTNSLEDLWCVVTDGVCSRELLAQEDGEGNSESVSVSWDQDFFPRHAFGQVEFFFNGGTDVCNLFHHLRIIDRLAAHVRQRSCCFLVSSLFDKPSGRFFQEEQSNKEQPSWNDLDPNLEATS